MENFVEHMPPVSKGSRIITNLYKRSGREKSPLFPLLNHIALIRGGFLADSRMIRESEAHALKFVNDNLACTVIASEISSERYKYEIVPVSLKQVDNKPIINMRRGIGVRLSETGITSLSQPFSIIEDKEIMPWNRILLTIEKLTSDKFMDFMNEYERRVNETPSLHRMTRLLKESHMLNSILMKPSFEAIQSLLKQSESDECVLSIDKFSCGSPLYMSSICHYNSRNSIVTFIRDRSIRTVSLPHQSEILNLMLKSTKAVETTRERLVEEYNMAFGPVRKYMSEIKKQRERLLSMF